MKPNSTTRLMSCGLCHRRDRIPPPVARNIAAGVVALQGYVCPDCGETDAGRALVAGWPASNLGQIESDEEMR